ncbi:MAG: deoxycytidylate deaminase [archaeon]
MERIGLHQMFMNIAFEVSKRSTCARVNVGALIVKDDRIVSMGWNGSPSGKEHCSDYFHERFQQEKSSLTFSAWKETDDFKNEHHQFAVENEVHAEMNSLIFSAKNGISINGADVYVTWSPCIDCSKALLQAGIKNVYYFYKYDREPVGVRFLEENGIKCWRVDEKGNISRTEEAS